MVKFHSYAPRWSMSLYARLALALALIFLFVGVVFSYMLLRSTDAHQRLVTQHLHRNLASHVVKEHLLCNESGLDIPAAKMIFMKLMVLGPNFEFYVLDPNGEIVAYSADPGVVKREQVSLDPVLDLIKLQDIQTPILGDNPRHWDQQKIFSAAPITQNGATIGYLYVILGSDIFDAFSAAFAQSKLLREALWLIIGILVFGLLASLLILATVTQPLTRLNRQVSKIMSAGFDAKSKIPASATLQQWRKSKPDEIHQLGASFRELLDKLEDQYTQIITIDELRKELLTHISHDLRTPLASLMGYLETWSLNRDTLSKEQADEYINIAQRNAQKIAKLIEQLFELAHLDSGNVQIKLESFSIAELGQDVLQKFAIEAQQKNIELKVEPKDPGIIVTGDIEKLERALTNLVENALRHTPENGSVTMHFSKAGRLVGVEVSDTGIGIPKEDIPHIFDAHYKAGNSVRGNSAHGGIGLAITKKIIALHKSDISVKSQVNRGTTFQFHLPFAGAKAS